ncbi:MAG TPA: alpha/beta hydrolase [Anaerolineales bacterium]|jgi:pimeloyl-ACP methyl ester carboxylesterase|nr:alpha/beta hydrolase [Anaerolineales bacterium]
MSAIVFRDEIVHYEVLGRGRPVVFLHGWIGSWRYWIPSMQSASSSFRAYALDLWGYGDTAKTSQLYSLDRQVDLLDGFVEKLGIGKVALVGHGLGGIVAALYATQNPDLVDRIMAISFPLENETLNARLLTSTPAELADWLLDRSPVHEPARGEAAKTDAQAIQISLDELKQIDLLDVSFRMATPCLWVSGHNDPAVSQPPVEYLSAMPDHIHHIVFDESGHFPMLDEPSKFNRLMADFLTLASGESPQNLQLKEEWKRRVR